MSTITGNRRVCLTRQYRFSAAHRLYSPFLSDAENEALYGKCGRSAGHGHNYTLRITLAGPVHPGTGLLCNVADLDEIVNRFVIEPFDHRDLNVEVEGLAVVSSETLAREIWDRLALHIKIKGVELRGVALEETRKNSVAYCHG